MESLGQTASSSACLPLTVLSGTKAVKVPVGADCGWFGVQRGGSSMCQGAIPLFFAFWHASTSLQTYASKQAAEGPRASLGDQAAHS